VEIKNILNEYNETEYQPIERNMRVLNFNLRLGLTEAAGTDCNEQRTETIGKRIIRLLAVLE